MFILQPDALYNYPLSLHRAPKHFDRPKQRHQREEFYALMQEADGYVDLTDLFEKWGQKAIVDSGHYSPNFNRFLAEAIASKVDLSQAKGDGKPAAVPTGIRRL